MKLKTLLISLVCLAVVFLISACSSPNDGGNNGVSNGSIVGTWEAGDTTLTFNTDGTYRQTVQGMIFDTGTYTASGGQCTMASNGGYTSTGSYHVSGNTLTGFTDGYGNQVTYTRP